MEKMTEDFIDQSEEYLPTDFWISYNKINYMLLRYFGVSNFARTDISHGFGGKFTKRFI